MTGQRKATMKTAAGWSSASVYGLSVSPHDYQLWFNTALISCLKLFSVYFTLQSIMPSTSEMRNVGFRICRQRARSASEMMVPLSGSNKTAETLLCIKFASFSLSYVMLLDSNEIWKAGFVSNALSGSNARWKDGSGIIVVPFIAWNFARVYIITRRSFCANVE